MNKSTTQKEGIVIWLLGLSGAGKTTLAKLLDELLSTQQYVCVRLDGDELRHGINADLGFSEESRAENVRRTAEIAHLLSKNGIITICSLITPMASHRCIARNILGENYWEVFVDCPLEKCIARDAKGLYQKAMQQLIPNFTGISSSFEPPSTPHHTAHTNLDSPEACANDIFQAVMARLHMANKTSVG
ncbi:adenylylsulfate kinase [bacterium A37T11]|nr:adenylylsulfate kinase [bacterium A37T11]